MHRIFDHNKAEAMLLVDAENAFNTINRKVLLQSTEDLCPELAVFIYNCFVIPA